MPIDAFAARSSGTADAPSYSMAIEDPTVPGQSTLTSRAIRGSAWMLTTSLGSRVVGLVGTLILARYLTPAEYGEVSAAWILVVTATSVTTFGVGIYLVSNRDVSPAETFHATCWFLATGVAILSAAMMFSGRLGGWFGAPDVSRFVPFFVLSGIVERVIFIPERILVRNLRFGWLSVARAIGEMTYVGVAVALAALGAGGVAIAWGNVARSLLRFFTIVPAVNYRDWLAPHRLRLKTMLNIVAYGINVSMAAVATFGMRRWDNLLVSRYFGPAVMGAYNYAYNLADMPAVAVGEQMSDVIGASFPHVTEGRRATTVVKASIMMALITFPLGCGLGAVAPSVVQTFFNEAWSAVGTMLVFLCVLPLARPIANVLASYLYSRKRLGTVAWIEWSSLAAMVLGVSTIGRIGVTWACMAVGAVFILRTLAGMYAVHRVDGIPLSHFLNPLAKPLLSSLVMVAVIVFVRPAFAGLSAPARLVTEILIGGSVYLGSVWLIAGSEARQLLQLAQDAFLSRLAASAPGVGPNGR